MKMIMKNNLNIINHQVIFCKIFPIHRQVVIILSLNNNTIMNKRIRIYFKTTLILVSTRLVKSNKYFLICIKRFQTIQIYFLTNQLQKIYLNKKLICFLVTFFKIKIQVKWIFPSLKIKKSINLNFKMRIIMKFFYQSVSKIKKKNLNNKKKSNIHHKNLTILTRVISHLSHQTMILKILKIVQNKSKMMKIQANKILISKM